MTSVLKNWVRKKGSSLLNPSSSSSSSEFSTAREGTLFTKVDPAVDGEDCDHDCATCTVKYPSRFHIDESSKLYGHVNGWSTHILVATGKTDWVRDVSDEKGSVMQAVGKAPGPSNGKLMLSASNIPIPDYAHDKEYSRGEEPTSVLLLPAFITIDHVTPNSTADLIKHIISTAPTNTTPLSLPEPGRISSRASPSLSPSPAPSSDLLTTTTTTTTSTTNTDTKSQTQSQPQSQSQSQQTLEPTTLPALPANLPFKTRPCPHDVLILMCSQRTRDARCGQSAPLLKKEFERHLRPLGLYRDDHDERPGGVGIYFISHVGGHKFSANVMIYRRAGMGKKAVLEGGNAVMQSGEGEGEGEGAGAGAGAGAGVEANATAAQCIWLARVRPEDCEGIVKYTVLQGKVVKPESQLRGGFDREKGLISW